MRLEPWMATAVLLFLSACSNSSEPSKPLPSLSFTQHGPIRLDVASVEVIDIYQPPQGGDNVEHLFSTPLQLAVRRWVSDRVKPVGRDGVVRVTIMDAKVVEQSLKPSGSWFSREPAERYTGRLEVLLEADSPGRRTTGNANVVVERSITVLEGISLADRSRAWFNMTQDMMADFNKAMEAKIRQHLAPLIR
jgi:hypothetical protein